MQINAEYRRVDYEIIMLPYVAKILFFYNIEIDVENLLELIACGHPW